jgi:hypothetical protein
MVCHRLDELTLLPPNFITSHLGPSGWLSFSE